MSQQQKTGLSHNLSLFSPERILGKKLPAQLEAEKAVLGALLLNDENIGDVTELLAAYDFYVPAHQVIYEAMLAIVQRSERVDIVTLQHELEKRGTLEKAGGVLNLLSLQEDIPSIGLMVQHAKIVKEKAVLRELIGSATRIITSCYDQDQEDISAVLDEAGRAIFQI